jgi:ADP-ribosylglycohydrolase
MAYTIRDAVYGSLIGGAIGDALGAAVEGWTYKRIKEEYGSFEEFRQYYMPHSNTEAGTITSEAATRHYLCFAIVQNSGRITPSEFANILRDHLNPNRVWVNEEILLKKLSVGVDPWSAGEGNIPDNKGTAAITPVGIINAGDPRQAYQDAFNIASMFQNGEHRHLSATVAAGTAEAVLPTATIDSVIKTMMEHSRGIASRAIDLGLGLSLEVESVDEFIELYYENSLDWRWPAVQWDREKYYQGEVYSANPIETVPVAIAILQLCDGNVDRSIVEAVNYGRDSDGIATITGSIAGALHGADDIREDWKTKCEEKNRDFFEELEDDPNANFRSMADRLVDALENERKKTSERSETLDQLLDNKTT